MLPLGPLGPVTLGTSMLGAGPDAAAAAELADAIIASGFGTVDTSNAYAAGQSERLLGGAIARAGGLPEGLRIVSKADADPVTRGFDGDRVRRSFEETLERLGVDRLPLLHLHDPYSVTIAEALAPGGAVEALVALRDQGLVDAIGIAAGPLELVGAYVETEIFDALLSHNRYTLADRTAEPLYGRAKELGMTVFNAAPFGGGILGGSAAKQGRYAYRPGSPELLDFIDAVRRLCGEWGVPIAAAALRFSTSHPHIDSTVVGVTSRERLAELTGLLAAEVPSGFDEAIASLGTPPPSTTD